MVTLENNDSSQRKTKLKIVPILTIIIIVAIFSPMIIWTIEGNKELNVLILDNTVPDTKYREHKGLIWELNNAKYVLNGNRYSKKADYYGFFPLENNKYEIRKIPPNLNDVDLIYIADSYGVYEKEFYGENLDGSRSRLIYGGMYQDDLESIEKYLRNGVTIISEFNTFGSPTKNGTRIRLYEILNVEWSGWIGRYFYDLSEDVEVPVWAVENWEAQNFKDWNFSGPGFVLADESDHIIVLEEKKDITSKGCTMEFTEEGRNYFGINESVRYNYWFDIIKTKDNATIYSYFILDLTDNGKNKLEEYKIPIFFPAIVYSNNENYKSYYFAGDFVDIDTVPYIYWIYGYDIFNKWTSSNQDEFENKGFFWHAYIPMLKKILSDIYSKKIS